MEQSVGNKDIFIEINRRPTKSYGSELLSCSKGGGIKVIVACCYGKRTGKPGQLRDVYR
jgi:hypothetical protein